MRVIDSHTAGEPTRVVIEGGPDLGEGSLADKVRRLEQDHIDFFGAVVNEPRGHEAMVGALLLPPSRPDCAAAVIYFNTLQCLGMCGHATIGLAATLHHLGRIELGRHRIETPVGIVEVHLADANTASIVNVESYRLHKDIAVDVPGFGPVAGDVAWGGNWFFLMKDSPVPLELENVRALTDFTLTLRKALEEAGVTGEVGAWIDHIELSGPAKNPSADSRNFVLCPGGAFDRSPCGTGSSAKLACLAGDGLLAPETDYVQESIIGSTYRLSYQKGEQGGVIPTITGQAFVTSEANLIFAPADPYRSGFTA
ncbi:hydroxyproline-2-epimerase [Roseibium denhamense]|uniref:4-hydroxyproline epimerase n=1 Tax=Roseibium denhamense TaxID=76305 RepID=A0ABY1PFW7_9HYPH|nr:proline racemase family protein [Roseibium denhamense]MTI06265.1 hydroxyproline-2-epimerase [Roseibium denhamense]SMP32935.1 Proline racemase [Roseibium denhamense]